MNKQGNTYTIIYIIVMVLVVGAALAFTAMSLRSRQQANADADKMRQILASVLVTPESGDVIDTYESTVTRSFIVDVQGQEVGGDAFAVNMAEQSKSLPCNVCFRCMNAVWTAVKSNMFSLSTVPAFGVPYGAMCRLMLMEPPFMALISRIRVRLPALVPKLKKLHSVRSLKASTSSRTDDFCP